MVQFCWKDIKEEDAESLIHYVAFAMADKKEGLAGYLNSHYTAAQLYERMYEAGGIDLEYEEFLRQEF